VSDASPVGYTLSFTLSSTLAVNPHLYTCLYAHAYVGTSSHLAMEYFRWRAGFDASPVRAKGRILENAPASRQELT
jgi:hypothetical protein